MRQIEINGFGFGKSDSLLSVKAVPGENRFENLGTGSHNSASLENKRSRSFSRRKSGL
jgi:hypothetical protein